MRCRVARGRPAQPHGARTPLVCGFRRAGSRPRCALSQVATLCSRARRRAGARTHGRGAPPPQTRSLAHSSQPSARAGPYADRAAFHDVRSDAYVARRIAPEERRDGGSCTRISRLALVSPPAREEGVVSGFCYARGAGEGDRSGWSVKRWATVANQGWSRFDRERTSARRRWQGGRRILTRGPGMSARGGADVLAWAGVGHEEMGHNRFGPNGE